MALNKVLLDCEKQGILTALLQNGFISYKIIQHKDIYLTYDINRKKGQKIMQAVRNTADQFQVSDETVRRAIKSMEEKK